MRYRDMVQFEPIETVIQLRTADDKEKARQLVETYVISERMADQFVSLVIPHIQFLTPHDNHGVLIVGNYGTGKSHLLSVISAVAEHADLVASLRNEMVRRAAEAIAGKFKVVRVEIGGVTMSLRDILLGHLEHALESWGIPCTFPPADKVSNNKDILIEAIKQFNQRYPEHGILLVVDELLDYLRSRNEQQLILDLGFLRELGEVCALTTFRFLGGLQESLFDNPRFSHMSNQLRRVRDRFEQILIVREDIAYVVAHRLLIKTPEQLARIADYLRPFAPLYHKMAERLGEFAALFPVHPAYLEVFERLYIAEKREVLRTLSRAIQAILDAEIPEDRPGLVAYDQYWAELCTNPSMRSVPEIAIVMDKSSVLAERVRNAYTRPFLREMALRIINALSVQRLTTDDINAPIGVTAEELRDDLCLYVEMPERTAEFLADQVRVALNEIIKTVNGQYISYEPSNGQYYLDIKKDIDFEAEIARRGEIMSKDDLNRYWFDALQQMLNLPQTTYVTGHRIWFYELPWANHGVTRPGYLFFGAPDERSTAQPPRDFYVYILPPYLERSWANGEGADEVVFQMSGLDETFEKMIRLYAGARALALESPTHRKEYSQKADDQFRNLARWFREQFIRHLDVTYQGHTETVRQVFARLQSSASLDTADLLSKVAAYFLEAEFEERYPDYPRFSGLREPMSEEGRKPNASEAIRALAGRARTQLVTSILQGLELLDEQGVIRPQKSRYAQRFLEFLTSRPEGQVVNRSDLIEIVAPGIQPVEKDRFFHLEPEWVAVLLVALVYAGDIELGLANGKTLDAGTLEDAATLPLEELTGFRLMRRPSALPVSLWAAIFEGLGLRPGLIRDPNQHEEAVRALQKVVGEELERTVRLEDTLKRGLSLWNEPIFTDVTIKVQDGTVIAGERPKVSLAQGDLLPSVREYKQFLEGLKGFTTVGRLRNLRLTSSEVDKALASRQVVRRTQDFVEWVTRLQPLTAYLAEAQGNMPPTHAWSERAEARKADLLDEVRRHARGEAGCNLAERERELETLKEAYISAYAAEHRRLVLGPADDERRAKLYDDRRLRTLEVLSEAISLFNKQRVEAWKRAVQELPTCRGFYEGVLKDTPTCPYCHLRPAQRAEQGNAAEILDSLDENLSSLLADWRRALADALKGERAQRSLDVMTPEERRSVEAFLAQQFDAADLPRGFIESAQKALRGLEVVSLSGDRLLEHLKAGGLPCTEEELQRRFAKFLRQALRGRDAESTRLTLE